MTSKQRVKYFPKQDIMHAGKSTERWENTIENFVNNLMIKALSITTDEQGVLLLYEDLSFT
jgi:hypothetical protein